MTTKSIFTREDITVPVHSWTYSAAVLVDEKVPDDIQHQFGNWGFKAEVDIWMDGSDDHETIYDFVLTPIGEWLEGSDIIHLSEGTTVVFLRYGLAFKMKDIAKK